MAFDQQGFGPIGGENMLAASVWSYRTSDSLADIQAASYFNDKVYQIEDGDFLFANTSDAVAFGFFNNDGSNVTVTIIEGSEGVENPWPPYREVSADTALQGVTDCIAVDCTAGDVTVFLPALAAGNYNVKKIDSSSNVVILDAGTNGSTLDGQATRNITGQWDNVTINSRPTEWARQ